MVTIFPTLVPQLTAFIPICLLQQSQLYYIDNLILNENIPYLV